MKVPSHPLVVPTALKKYANGLLPDAVLAKIAIGGKMYKPAAYCFNLMVDDAKKSKIVFKNIGDYRPLERQEALFKERYALKSTGRVPEVTRTYNGKTWYLKKGMSPSAAPQTSPHGWGLAIDIDVTNPKVFAWLCKNAPKYGFYLQGQPTLPNGKPNPEYEAWHWQWAGGDSLPKAVKAMRLAKGMSETLG